MYEATADLPIACLRSLRAASAREHCYAETRRKAAQVQRSRPYDSRADRLSLLAARAQARAAEFAMEVR